MFGFPIESPIPGIEGQWVSRDFFYYNSKTFGYFQCEDCNRHWTSAHSFKNYEQACKQCFNDTLPSYLWKNKTKSKKKVIKQSSGFHQSELCSACQVGVCKLSQNEVSKNNVIIKHANIFEDYFDYY